MSTIIENLTEFVDAAERNRKYPAGTAAGRRSALRLFEPELTDEEKESLDTLKEHLEQIFQNVFNKNKSKMTAASLTTYKRRLLSLISDYERHGTDPNKMASWNRTIRKVATGVLKSKGKIDANHPHDIGETVLVKSSEVSRFELPLRPGIKAIILVPSDITKEEVGKLRRYVDFLESISLEGQAGKGE